MEIRTVLSAIILLVSLVIMEPVFADERVSSPCDNCLMVSRKAEAALNSQILFAEARKLSKEACHVFPAIFQYECLKKSGDYMHEARHILQEFFDEGNLCNGTGLCAKSELAMDNCLGLNDQFTHDLFDERGCITCRKAVRSLFTRLKNPKMRSKIVEFLLDYCEDAEEDEDQCKQKMHQYGPLMLRKFEKLKPSKFCSMLGMCGEEITMKI